MEEELVRIGYNNSLCETYRNVSQVLLVNSCQPKDKEEYINLYHSEFPYDGSKQAQFLLPEEWDECLTFCKEQLALWDKVKVGDWVFGTDGFTCKVTKIDSEYLYTTNKYHPHGNSDGSHTSWQCIGYSYRLATPKEIEEAKSSITIAGYRMTVGHHKAVFGCQYITKEEINTLKKFIGYPINAKISIQNTEITTELLNKILNRL